jgi:hypothetical protein
LTNGVDVSEAAGALFRRRGASVLPQERAAADATVRWRKERRVVVNGRIKPDRRMKLFHLNRENFSQAQTH